jgi:biofilm PGA synthesis N-glycosyltransferase PgaC
MTRPPLLIGGIAMLWGYLKSAFTRLPRYEDPDFRKFLRKYQIACLVKGKHAATKEAEAKFSRETEPVLGTQ